MKIAKEPISWKLRSVMMKTLIWGLYRRFNTLLPMEIALQDSMKDVVKEVLTLSPP